MVSRFIRWSDATYRFNIHGPFSSWGQGPHFRITVHTEVPMPRYDYTSRRDVSQVIRIFLCINISFIKNWRSVLTFKCAPYWIWIFRASSRLPNAPDIFLFRNSKRKKLLLLMVKCCAMRGWTNWWKSLIFYSFFTSSIDTSKEFDIDELFWSSFLIWTSFEGLGFKIAFFFNVLCENAENGKIRF